MIPSQLRDLLDELSSSILLTDDPDKIDRGRAFGYFLLNSPHQSKSTSRGISHWKSIWKKSVRPDNVVLLETISESLPDEPHPIYSLLNMLQRSTIGEPKKAKAEEKSVNKTIIIPTIPEQLIVSELMKLLRGGNSFILRLDNNEVETDQPISAPHAALLKQILKYVFCMKLIKNSRKSFNGTIGDAMRLVVDTEYASYVDTISKIDESKTSLVSLFSILSSQVKERIFATTIVCEVVTQSSALNQITAVMQAQTYALPQIAPLTMRMVDAGIDVLLTFIRNWTVYGHLVDSQKEFFVEKVEDKIDDEKWWNEKYILVRERVPSSLIDDKTLAKILSSGRAHNFVRKFQKSCVDYGANFGYDAPFAVNFEQPKAKRVNPELAWSGPKFELSMVPRFATESMKQVMYMMNNVVWIPGHLKVVQDFILFARGDFASVLYQNFSNSTDGDAKSLLLQSINAVTNSKDYTNGITNECLTDRIDMQKIWTIQPLPHEALIQYLVNPPIDAFLGKQAMSKYDTMGHFLWKLKCNECQLTVNWRNARRLQYLRVVGFDIRKMGFVRHLMINFVRAFTEYLSTDVIIISGKQMDTAMSQSEDFQEILEIHSKRLDKLMKGSLHTPEYSGILKMMMGMMVSISEFTDLEQEIEGVYNSIVNYMKKRNTRSGRKSASFINSAKEELANITERAREIHAKFSDQLGEFYTTCFDDSNSVEMQQLENRIYWCVVNLR